jgi:hypothetical protein
VRLFPETGNAIQAVGGKPEKGAGWPLGTEFDKHLYTARF